MSTLNLTFTNNSGHHNKNVSIGFVPGSTTAAFNITNATDNSAINELNYNYSGTGNWYTLTELQNGVNITNFSGRIYVCYDGAWAVQGNGYEPAQAVNDPNFYLRYDKMEITFNGDASDVANLTSIDYWSIPMSLSSSFQGSPVAGNSVAGLVGTTTAQDIYNTLSNLTPQIPAQLPGIGGPDGSPIQALVPGSFVQYGSGPAPLTTFARIIGPSSYPPIYPNQAIPVTPYALFSGYLTQLINDLGVGTAVGSFIAGLGNGMIATIAGNFEGVGPKVPSSGPQSKQAYNLAATIDNDMNITLTGIVGSGTTTNTTMFFAVDDLLNPSGIYGGNTPFSLNGAASAPPANDVYGWISGDLFSGINIGAIGSLVVDTNNQEVGSLTSSEWFQLPVSMFFGGLQANSACYNQWAAALQPLSQAYSYAYTDRFAHVFASLNPSNVDTLIITLEDDNIIQ
ncbi:MAG: beta-1,3-glucanase family protein [Fluviicola sp.]|nr:beta-1,3-glucanase family protein [Fluviicola sp.]